MAEAFAVIGIAANIAQLVDYGFKLLSATKEIYNSLHGTRDEYYELETIVEDIKNLQDNLRTNVAQQTASKRSFSSDEKAFEQLAEECRRLATELLRILNDLKISKGARFRSLESVRQMLRGVGKRKDVEDLRRRLQSIDKRLRIRASNILRKNNHSQVLQAINELNATNERMQINSIVQLDRMKVEIIEMLNSKDAALEKLSKRLVALAEEGQKVEHEQRILDSLTFRSMKQREAEIKEAHKATLQWIFDDPQSGFMKWLQEENDTYWIKGKAGSGKSTLMKYICEHETTLQGLHRWAGSESLVTASYFFWNAGLPMQKSQTGLLQSLLYQILRTCPVLIIEVCSSTRSTKEPWSTKELFEALDNIAGQGILPAKFCFFIDGLDEYEGYDEDLVRLLKRLAAFPSIKLCVSSRPWNAFLDAYDDRKWKLVLEDLTKADMQKYVQNLLAENETFTKIAKEDPRCNTLVPQVAEKADGVWLWVYLVVRDLLRDIKGEEEYTVLQRRLDSFPQELEKYFEDILSRIDRIHRAETAKIFLTTVEAVRPLPVLALKYLNLEDMDPEYALKAEIAPVLSDEASKLFRRWKKLLNSRCRDLLEVNTYSSEQTFLKYKVDFLHRSVRDFLRDNYQSELRKRTPEGFDPGAALCSIFLALTKALPVSTGFTSLVNQLFGLVDELLYYGRETENRRGDSNVALLDELDRVNTVHATDFRNHWTNARDPPTPSDMFEEYGQCTYVALAIQSRLRLYVTEKLNAHPTLLQEKKGRPLLDYALRHHRVTPAELPYQLQHLDTNIDVQVISLLLSRGADPNQKVHIYQGNTVWGLFLLYCYESHGQVLPHVKDAWYEAAELLIEYGADPQLQVDNPTNDFKKVGTTARYKRDVVVEVKYLTVAYILQKVFSSGKAGRLESRMTELAQQRQDQPSFLWRMLGY